jgi:NADH-quinone oxidoreductase subunit E
MSTESPIEPKEIEELNKIVEGHGAKPESMLQILLDINNRFNYLPEEMLRILSERVGMPLAQVYSIATFFKAFSLTPRGRHIINVCQGTACHVKGGQKVNRRVEHELKIKDGETTGDRRYTMDNVRCLGCCSLAPVMVIDGETYSRLSSEKIPKILKQYE